MVVVLAVRSVCGSRDGTGTGTGTAGTGSGAFSRQQEMSEGRGGASGSWGGILAKSY